MPPQAAEIENLAHAYRVLDVPWDASPRAIKASYRKLVKRWHPDRYPPGTESHSANADAGADLSGSSRNECIPRDPQQDAADFYRIMERARVAGARDDTARPFDWFGFIVRFVLGALFGVLMGFEVMVRMWTSALGVSHDLLPLAMAATILFCAFASAFGGDAFWRSIRPSSTWWWRQWD
ncbi:MAG: DnaJ domain-containing protein [Candidatus Acidiferrales bacterium]